MLNVAILLLINIVIQVLTRILLVKCEEKRFPFVKSRSKDRGLL